MVQKAMVEIKTPDGTMPAHWVRPEGAGPFPGVVVLMEAFGLVEHIEEVAERLAGEGYAVLAPDLYYRKLPDNKVGYDELPKAIELLQGIRDDAFVADMKAALAFLKDSGQVKAGGVGMTGFCMGGRLTFLSACALPGEIKAAAPFYGGGIHNHLGQAAAIQCPLELFFADNDGFIPSIRSRRSTPGSRNWARTTASSAMRMPITDSSATTAPPITKPPRRMPGMN